MSVIAIEALFGNRQKDADNYLPLTNIYKHTHCKSMPGTTYIYAYMLAKVDQTMK